MNIVPIVSPNINSTQYGKNIDDVFNNINKNFEILSNHDFVKGDKGNSIRIETIDLTTNTDILNQLKTAVTNQHVNTPKVINGVSVLDYFNDPGNITLIYEEIGDTDVLISSLPYTFKDLRFQNLTNASDYINEIDYSCIITFDKGGFTAIQAFPTIYFNELVGSFCWIINGIKTGLEAQGPRGAEGKAGVFKSVIAVKDNINISADVYKISQILTDGEWVDVLSGEVGLDHSERCSRNGVTQGTPVMVLIGDDDDNRVYLSEAYLDDSISAEENRILVICNELNQVFDVRPIPISEVENLCDEIWNA